VGNEPATASTACFATRCRGSGTIFSPLKIVELGAPKAAVDPVDADETELADPPVTLLELRLLLDVLADEDDIKDDWEDELLEVDIAELLVDVAERDELGRLEMAAKLDEELLEETVIADVAWELDRACDELAGDELFDLEPPDPPQPESNKISAKVLKEAIWIFIRVYTSEARNLIR
jgi:hypothetical protein